MALYLVGNFPNPTTAAPSAVATGATIKTLLQIKPKIPLKIVEWGISFDGFAAAAPGKVSLFESDVAATVTAFVNNDLSKVDNDALNLGDATTNIFEVGTAASGYTGSAEGTITATRPFDLQQIAPTNQYVKQFPLGREPVIQVGKFGRIRVTFGTTVNALCYMVLST